MLVKAHVEEAACLVHVILAVREADGRILEIFIGEHTRVVLALVEKQVNFVSLFYGLYLCRTVVVDNAVEQFKGFVLLFLVEIVVGLTVCGITFCGELGETVAEAIGGIGVVGIKLCHLIVVVTCLFEVEQLVCFLSRLAVAENV